MVSMLLFFILFYLLDQLHFEQQSIRVLPEYHMSWCSTSSLFNYDIARQSSDMIQNSSEGPLDNLGSIYIEGPLFNKQKTSLVTGHFDILLGL